MGDQGLGRPTTLIRATDRRDDPGGSPSKVECAKRAAALFQQAVAKGWKDAEHRNKDPDLASIRDPASPSCRPTSKKRTRNYGPVREEPREAGGEEVIHSLEALLSPAFPIGGLK